ncbi:uncharacterized protein CTRU02_202125 [Colletotrichum truncatum]|uniref:Uncharacterized protein n=1 Tax=Colletotrichum truncatum TaxID=5467 RepID=A0ACC3ZJU7_COLTU|nr:uncharacterized protein CTRU02_14254 [Colletotrichum truncatum]KAF6782361.1 hypothetical protein CTRU02_14254 [Colletotrichum truncatum]
MHALRRCFPRILSSRSQRLSLIPHHTRPLSKQPSLGRDAKARHDLIFPNSPTTKHHDLASFLIYAERAGLDISSTVYVGTHYEYTVSSALTQYGIHTERIGGTSDYGIDLLGIWKLPRQKDNMRIIIQCKGGSQRVSPALIRELEGSFIGAPVGWRGEGVIALLVSEKTSSKGVREAIGRSRWPMGFISCSRDGVVQQMLWNQRAEEEGLRGVGVAIRHPESKGGQSQVVLTYQGKSLQQHPDKNVSNAG